MTTTEPSDGPATLDFRVGDRVVVSRRKVGTLRYIGSTALGSGIWFGVQLDKPLGLMAGTVAGKTYFECDPKHGVFVRITNLQHYDPEDMAATSIQATTRRLSAEVKAAAQRTWHMFNVLDGAEEHLHIIRRQRLIEAGLRMDAAQAESKDPLPSAPLDDIEIEDDYDGPHLTFPLTVDGLNGMLEYFKHGHTLHYKYTMQLLMEFRRAAAHLPTLMETTVAPGTTLTVCGDLHGQLQDLFSIFTINDLPSRTNRVRAVNHFIAAHDVYRQYLFNGDFVDRGPFGVEIVLVLVALFLLFPESVILHRGNHEERTINETAGFMEEVFQKYPGNADDKRRAMRTFDMFQACFQLFPLATVIDKKIFVTHGGLFDRKGVKLAHIAAIKRKRPVPRGRANFEDCLFEDLLWSDPRPMMGFSRSERGAGTYFGKDITAQFCKVNSLEFIIRSHECVREGYSFMHGNRVMTLFSASKYMGSSDNKGAFLVLEHGSKKHLQQFIAHSMAATSLRAPAETDAERESQVLQMIIQRVVESKPELFWFFTHADTAHTGHVTRLEWAEGMRTVLGLDLPWLTLSEKLLTLEANGLVNYGRFLDRYRIEIKSENAGWQSSVIQRICEKLFAACGSVERAYKHFDLNQDNKIEYEEFLHTIMSLDLGMSEQQVYELMSTIDVDRDSHIDFSEFAARFQVVFTKYANAQEAARAAGLVNWSDRPCSPDAPSSKIDGDSDEVLDKVDDWTRETLTRIGNVLLLSASSSQEAFQRMDTDGDGAVSPQEFAAALNKLGMKFTPEEVKKLLVAIDTNRSGRINYKEFVTAFKVADVGSLSHSSADPSSSAAGSSSLRWEQRLIDRITGVLFEYRMEMRALFQLFDTDASGRITLEEFKAGMQVLTALTGERLTSLQISELMAFMDKDGDGTLDYDEFFGGFSVVDMDTASRRA